jgi:hypothetical protein
VNIFLGALKKNALNRPFKEILAAPNFLMAYFYLDRLLFG